MPLVWIGRGALAMLGIGGVIGIASGVSTAVRWMLIIGSIGAVIYWVRK